MPWVLQTGKWKQHNVNPHIHSMWPQSCAVTVLEGPSAASHQKLLGQETRWVPLITNRIQTSWTHFCYWKGWSTLLLCVCFLVELKSYLLCSIKTQIFWDLIILIFLRRDAPAFPRSWGSQLSSLLFLKRKEVFLLEFPVLDSLVWGYEVVRGGRLII